MSLSKLREMVKDGEAWRAAVGVTKSQTRLATEQEEQEIGIGVPITREFR